MSGDLMDDEEYLQEHIKGLEASVRSFSPQNKQENERYVVDTFVRNLGIDFADDEIKSSEDEPPDVNFRDARFEIKEILDPGRRRHDEYRDELERARTLTKASDTLRSFYPKDISLDDIYQRCEEVVLALEKKYPPAVRSSLDLLFYVNLMDVMYVLEEPFPNVARLASTGWRSISFEKGQRSCCFYARDDAPEFIRNTLGHVTHRYPPTRPSHRAR
jgi:hypothetical protein